MKRWQSDQHALPKIDVYGLGAMWYCMANGRPPYVPPQLRDPAMRARLDSRTRCNLVAELARKGPTFAPFVAAATQDTLRRLMDNDVASRPTSTAARALALLRGVACCGIVTTFDLVGGEGGGVTTQLAPVRRMPSDVFRSCPESPVVVVSAAAAFAAAAVPSMWQTGGTAPITNNKDAAATGKPAASGEQREEASPPTAAPASGDGEGASNRNDVAHDDSCAAAESALLEAALAREETS
jgi:hypothetical protein